MWTRRRLAPILPLLLLAPLLAPLTALADGRPFPPGTKRGTMTPAWHPAIIIDGKTRTLSPAARIFNQDNTIEMPASLRGRDLVVNYQEDADGLILNVWLLTPEEAAQRPVTGR
ncbi:hypothetical protein LJR289_005843 [Pseudoduganella sp. LjRoot289]|uniref:hypothetical protein n=1 Tax=Pseudoduganella sp. LjRoot289 TaxID=3342314 RepID=UPI003ECDABD0